MRLILQDGDSKRGLRLKDGTFSIGSGDDCKITLESAGVAEHHADLVVVGGTVSLEPVSSNHPVKLGGETMKGSAQLESGQLFTIGGARFKFDATPAAAEKAPAAKAPRVARASGGAAARPERVERSSRRPQGQSFPTWLILVLAVPAVLLAYKFFSSTVNTSQQDGFSEKTSHLRIQESLAMSDPDKALKELEVVYSHSDTLSAEWREIFDDLRDKANGMGKVADVQVDVIKGEQYIDRRLKKFKGRYLLKNTRPEAREFVRRADKFLKEFAGHPDTSWVRRQRDHYAKYGKPNEAATLDDLLVEVKFLTGGKPKNFIKAHKRIAEFRARTEEGASDLVTRLSELKDEEKEYYEERIDQAAGLWERDNKKDSLGQLMTLVWGLSNPVYSDDVARRITQMPGVLNAMQGYKREQASYLKECADANANLAAFLKDNGL